ncbi:acyl-CoA thioesterase [Falsiroseomonas sp. CW058]|uniref:acyl-CoA thioesterase n=1 Tax=Falsiroseomonas sp. CW058 TaxID=3388664 RepID=UPI003D321918
MNPAEWTILRPQVIRWAQCDLYGHVNHTAYLTMFEDLRVDHWQAVAGARISPDRPGPVVAQIEARYLRAVGFGDEVVLGCRTVALRRTSYTQDYVLWKDAEPCVTARSVVVVTRQDTGAKVPLPPEIRARLIAEGAREE